MRLMVFPLREQYGLSIISNEEEAERKGKAFVKFYSELTAAGIDPKDALQASQGMFAAPGDVLKEHFAKELDVVCEIALTAITGTRGSNPEAS